MAYYSQWFRTRPLRRLTWVCGPEHVLAADVTGHYRSHAGEHVSLVAGADPERDIWAACSQPPADPGAVRLVLVRCAQRLRGWEELDALVAARDLGSVLVLWHSDEDDFTSVRTDGGSELAPHLARLRDYRSGQLIRCVVPDASGSLPEWVVAWAGEILGGKGPVLGAHLLAAAGDDLPEAANIAAKLRAAGAEPTRESVSALGDPAADYVEAVVAGRRAAALGAAASLERDELGSSIGLLASRLDTLSVLHQAAVRKLDARDTAVSLGVGRYLQGRYRKLAQGYGPQRVSACRSVLALAEDAWRSGITEGVAEVVAVLWSS